MNEQERLLLSAYAAGFFDGEGSVTISNKSTGGRKYWDLLVRIAQQNNDVFADLREIWGGKLYGKYDGRKNECMNWYLRGDEAVTFLRDIIPFLRCKRRQAELGIEFRDKCYGGSLTEEIRARRDWYKDEISAMNAQRKVY